ncbi:protein kinase [Streptomyces sp. NPDC052042]|uniref:protein kinase domain-containing protein n=1 Tax=Streptomyces sp. NPDC052042 TaxID=3365683 RepID=UPI0037D0C6C0
MDKLGPADPLRIDGYRLLGRLGAGGMGQVYLARSDRGRTVAIKLVRGELAERQEFRDRFRREVRAARRIGSAWTAPVLDADTEAAVPWVATGYVAGPSLQATVSGRPGPAAATGPVMGAASVAGGYGPLPQRSVHILGTGLAHALRAIHAAGLVHRDLKPSNILLTIDGPRVIDFGIARALDTVTDGGLTRTGALVGSPGFMSPEQVRGERVTPACDVFCLGSVLAYASTGRLPFGASDSGAHAQMYRIAQEEPDLTGVPVDLVELVRDCLHKDPAARPSTDAILDRLADYDATEPWLPAALIAQLGRHAVELLDSENPEEDPEKDPEQPLAANLPATVDGAPSAPPVTSGPPAPSASSASLALPASPTSAASPASSTSPASPVSSASLASSAPDGSVTSDASADRTAPYPPDAVHTMPTMVGTPVPEPLPAPPSHAYGYPPQQPAHPHPGQVAFGTQQSGAGHGYPQQSLPCQQPGFDYQQPGFDATPPYGPLYTTASQPAPEPVRRGNGATIALIAVAVLVAIGAGGSVYALMSDKGQKPAPSATVSPPSAGTSAGANGPDIPASPASDGSPSGDRRSGDGPIPSGYLGSWAGAIDSPSGRSTRELVIRQGAVGQTVLTLTADGPLDGGGSYHCVFEAALAAEPSASGPMEVGASAVVVGEPMPSCTAGKPTVLTLLPDGSLRRENTDGSGQLTYTRSG